ncbi:hypothetical protein [Dokdonia sp.]|uniref:hypothetical protein n=1 Tax=Dokdonia sp. TaxID=2024995 RepID=UPI003263EE2B
MIKYIALLLFSTSVLAQNTLPKTAHIFVALCDNVNQGIIPVPKTLGNGQNPKTNLYWGALYGVKTHFKKSKDWTFIQSIPSDNPQILERVLFKHATTNTYLLADAYNGKYIKQTTIDFLKASSGGFSTTITINNKQVAFGGKVDLVSYIGHDGLMEFQLDIDLKKDTSSTKDAIILACYSKDFFKPYFSKTGANPLVWSTGLMAPEAYTLKWALDGWIQEKSNSEIRELAAQAYNHYQKCGIRGARNLLVTGY